MLDPLWVVNAEDRIVDINPAFTKLFGHTREEVIGASVYDFFDDKMQRLCAPRWRKKGKKG
jgi:PAS domain S-box-containing protein